MEGIKKAMNERNLNEGQWKDWNQWSLGVGQRRKSFETDIYIYYITFYFQFEKLDGRNKEGHERKKPK